MAADLVQDVEIARRLEEHEERLDEHERRLLEHERLLEIIRTDAKATKELAVKLEANTTSLVSRLEEKFDRRFDTVDEKQADTMKAVQSLSVMVADAAGRPSPLVTVLVSIASLVVGAILTVLASPVLHIGG